MGKLIVIEGTDCSGKETQSKLLVKRLLQENILIETFSFPNYESPTGRIVGGPYLGKPELSKSYFLEGAVNVSPLVASLYFAADRLYNIDKIKELLNNGVNVLLDRYTYSNMGHQANKILDKEKRNEMYEWLEELEFNLLKLPKPDILIFLHLPYNLVNVLRNKRELLDEHECDETHLRNAEKAYLEIAKKYNFHIIKCFKNNKIRSIEEINDELKEIVKKELV